MSPNIVRWVDNLNKSQKIAFLITAGVCFLLLALHNPFGGYRTSRYSSGLVYDIGLWWWESRNAVSIVIGT